jgi:hypothetical protein
VKLPVIVRTVGLMPDPPEVTWPEGWPPPGEDQVVYLKDGTPTWVRAVDWYPEGNRAEEGRFAEPHVYVVIGRRRPT